MLLAALHVYVRALVSPLFSCSPATTETHNSHQVLQSKEGAKTLFFLFAALVLGSVVSTLFSNPHLHSVLPSLESALGLVAISLVTTVIRVIGILAGESILLFDSPSDGPWTSALVPTATFALAGTLGESLGVERTLWWVHHGGGSIAWLAGYGGQPLVDFVVAGLGAAGAWMVLNGGVVVGAFRKTHVEERFLMDEEDISEEVGESVAQLAARPQPSLVRRLLPFLPFALFLLPAILGQIIPPAAFHPKHPSPGSPTYRYPPVKVACVVPPGVAERYRRTKPDVGPIDEWLHETTVVASRGATIVVARRSGQVGAGGGVAGGGWDRDAREGAAGKGG